MDAPVNPQTTNTIVGDLLPILDSNGNLQYDSLGNVITNPNSPAPNRNDMLYDSSANDRIEGKGGDDTIYADKGGDDWLLGGDGDDAVSATLGNDIAEGNTGADVVFGGQGFQPLAISLNRKNLFELMLNC